MELVTTHIDGRIARVEFSREDGRNALSFQLMTELRDTALMLQKQSQVTAVVLHGCGGNFSAGADLADVSKLQQSNLLELRESMKLGPEMCKAWEDIEAYTIAAIEGYCIGGGAALVAALDYRILSESGQMRLPEIALGMNMSWQTIPRLVAQIGPARTKQFVILSEALSAQQAREWGLVEELVNSGEALSTANTMAERVAALPPIPVKMSKTAINASANALAQASSFMDRDQYLLSVLSDDFKEAMAAFFDKRAPEFKGN